MQNEGEVQFQLNSSAANKLTDWDNEPNIITLKADLEAAKPAHDAQIKKIKRWNDLMQVSGDAKPKKQKNRSSVQPKLIRRQAEWRYPALTEPFLGSNKLFTIKPTTWEDSEGARQNELVLNYQFRTKLNRVKFIDDYVRSTVDEGSCIVRIGWKRSTVMVNKEVPVYSFYSITNEEQLQKLQQAIELQQADPRHYNENVDEATKAAVDFYQETSQATYAVQTGTNIEKVEKVLENRPDLKVFNPQNVILDPSSEGDIDKAMFAIFSFETSKAELQKEDTKYKNLDRINWDSATPATDGNYATKTPTNFQFRDRARRKVVAYEYWGFYDIQGDGNLVPIVCTWIGDTIIRMEESPMPDGKLPLVLVPYTPVKRELYGEPDAELLEDNQKILGAVSRGMIDLLGRSANSQQGFAKGMLDPLNRRRFEDGQDYEFNPNMPPQNGHIQHKYPEFPQSAFMMLNLQNEEAEALTGVKSFSGGLSGTAYGDVAAGIKGLLDAAAKREMSILRRLAYGMVEIARKIVAMNAEFLSEEETIRITNEKFEKIRREDLKGNYDFEVDISTAEVDNAQAQDLAFMLQTIGPNTDIELTKMIMAKIATLKRMPELAHQIIQFQPQPDPLEQKKKELEIEELKAKIDDLRAKARLSMAKAAESDSEKDLKDLDYLEQETGTHHAREIQKQEAQSRGNQNLAITKALTTPTDPEKQKPNIEAAVGFNEFTDAQNARELGVS